MKQTIRLFVILFSISLIGITITGCQDYTNVRYEVTGTASTVNITMRNSSGGIEQMSNVTLPWSTSFDVPWNTGFFASISAQNNGSSGSVTVKIFRSGNLFKESTSVGAFVISSASGNIDN